jgi:hypothetical protein
MAPRANWKGFLRLSLRPVGRAGDVGQREGLLQPEQQEHRPPHSTLKSMPRPARKRPVRTSSRATRLTPTLTSQSTRRARQHRAREHTHYRHGRNSSRSRRSTSSNSCSCGRTASCPRAGRPRRRCCDPRDHSQHGQGRHRARRPHQPRHIIPREARGRPVFET